VRSGRAPRDLSRSTLSTTFTSARSQPFQRLGGAQDVKQRLLSAVNQIAPVRNEIAHVREVDRERLLRTSVACADVIEMLQARTGVN
jgi:ribonuclease D